MAEKIISGSNNEQRGSFEKMQEKIRNLGKAAALFFAIEALLPGIPKAQADELMVNIKEATKDIKSEEIRPTLADMLKGMNFEVSDSDLDNAIKESLRTPPAEMIRETRDIKR